MSKKNGAGSGLVALVAGVAAGAAAVFLSKKENRIKTKKVLVSAEKKVISVSKEAKKNPKKFAKKVVKVAAKDVKMAEAKAMKVEKTVAKKVKSSPVLKKVGKSLKMSGKK